MTQLLRQSLLPPGSPLSTGYPGLLVHTGIKHATEVARVCAAEGLGAVISVRGPSDRAKIAQLLGGHRIGGAPTKHVLFDAEEYAGKNRMIGADAMDPAWVRRQIAAGCEWALTNSGYIGEGDVEARSAVLKAGAKMGGNTITALPIHASHLQGNIRRFSDDISSAGQPVAIMLEHSADPFGVRATTRGFVQLLDLVEVPVINLRSDLSAVGAVAFGATAGAIGTTTTRRHIWPSKGGGGGRPPSIAALVPRVMSFVSLSKINDAILYGSDPVWHCQCEVCFGRSLDWVATSEEAFLHSLSASAQIAREMFDPGLDDSRRRTAWINRCQDAQTYHFEASSLARASWEPPKFLGSWVAMAAEIAGA